MNIFRFRNVLNLLVLEFRACDVTRRNVLVNLFFAKATDWRSYFFTFFVCLPHTNVCLYSTTQSNNVTRSLPHTWNVYVIPFLFGIDTSIYLPSIQAKRFTLIPAISIDTVWSGKFYGSTRSRLTQMSNNVAKTNKKEIEITIQFMLRSRTMRLNLKQHINTCDKAGDKTSQYTYIHSNSSSFTRQRSSVFVCC